MWSRHENLQFCFTRFKQYEMENFSFSRKIFRVYGLLPLDGDNFGRFKCLEFLRVILLPLPSFLMGIAQLAYFVVNIRDLGKATVALYCGFGFLNAIFGYSLAIYHRRKFLKLINDMQATVDRSKIQILQIYNFQACWYIFMECHALGRFSTDKEFKKNIISIDKQRFSRVLALNVIC